MNVIKFNFTWYSDLSGPLQSKSWPSPCRSRWWRGDEVLGLFSTLHFTFAPHQASTALVPFWLLQAPVCGSSILLQLHFFVAVRMRALCLLQSNGRRVFLGGGWWFFGWWVLWFVRTHTSFVLLSVVDPTVVFCSCWVTGLFCSWVVRFLPPAEGLFSWVSIYVIFWFYAVQRLGMDFRSAPLWWIGFTNPKGYGYFKPIGSVSDERVGFMTRWIEIGCFGSLYLDSLKFRIWWDSQVSSVRHAFTLILLCSKELLYLLLARRVVDTWIWVLWWRSIQTPVWFRGFWVPYAGSLDYARDERLFERLE